MIRKYEKKDLRLYWLMKSSNGKLLSRNQAKKEFRGIGGEEMEEIGVEGLEWNL
jgi:hypothetical protein